MFLEKTDKKDINQMSEKDFDQMLTIKCTDCGMDTVNAKGWYAEFTLDDKKVMRCPECGKSEEEKRYKMRFGDKPRPKSFYELPVNERIQYSKQLRKAGLSPWLYTKMEDE